MRWGMPFRARHVTTGRYLAREEERGLVLVDAEKANTKATAFCFRISKVHGSFQPVHYMLLVYIVIKYYCIVCKNSTILECCTNYDMLKTLFPLQSRYLTCSLK